MNFFSQGAPFLILVILLAHSVDIEAQSCRPSVKIRGKKAPPGKCNKENDSECCVLYMAGQRDESTVGQGIQGTDPNLREMIGLVGRIANALESSQNNQQHSQVGESSQVRYAIATDDLTLLERFVKLKPTVFAGGANSDEAEEWISNKEKLFERMQLTPSQKVSLATFYLSEDAGFWWKTIDTKWTAGNVIRTWDLFNMEFNNKPPVPQWQAGRFPSTSGDRKFLRTDMRSMAYTPRPQTQGFMPRPFITGPRPQPRPGVRPTQYIPPQQQLVQAVSRYCTFCGMTGHTEE
ncbi:hypothetical protein RJ640_019271, partial [Escallonia rubra]